MFVQLRIGQLNPVIKPVAHTLGTIPLRTLPHEFTQGVRNVCSNHQVSKFLHLPCILTVHYCLCVHCYIFQHHEIKTRIVTSGQPASGVAVLSGSSKCVVRCRRYKCVVCATAS